MYSKNRRGKGFFMKMDLLFENKYYKRHREKLLCVLDVLIVILSFFLSVTLKFDFAFPYFLSANWVDSFMLLLSVVIVYVACFLLFRIHRSLWKYVGPQEVVRLCISVATATIILCGCHFLLY